MAVKITDVKLIPSYNWQGIKSQRNWQSVKDTNSNWSQLEQTSLASQVVTIEVSIIENTWDYVKQSNTDWSTIKNSYPSWNSLKNI